MTKKDFHGIVITQTIYVISKNKEIKDVVSKLFYDIKYNKIEKIIQAILSYNDLGLVGACLKLKTLSNKDIKNNSKYFSIGNYALISYIEISKECCDLVIKTINDYMDKKIKNNKTRWNRNG